LGGNNNPISRSEQNALLPRAVDRAKSGVYKRRVGFTPALLKKLLVNLLGAGDAIDDALGFPSDVR
jgi:hypothetical protein